MRVIVALLCPLEISSFLTFLVQFRFLIEFTKSCTFFEALRLPSGVGGSLFRARQAQHSLLCAGLRARLQRQPQQGNRDGEREQRRLRERDSFFRRCSGDLDREERGRVRRDSGFVVVAGQEVGQKTRKVQSHGKSLKALRYPSIWKELMSLQCQTERDIERERRKTTKALKKAARESEASGDCETKLNSDSL